MRLSHIPEAKRAYDIYMGIEDQIELLKHGGATIVATSMFGQTDDLSAYIPKDDIRAMFVAALQERSLVLKDRMMREYGVVFPQPVKAET